MATYIQLTSSHRRASALPSVWSGIKKAAASPVEWLRRYYSGVLHKEISTRRTLRLVHAQLAFVMAVFPLYDSLLVHMLVALWLVWAVARCRS